MSWMHDLNAHVDESRARAAADLTPVTEHTLLRKEDLHFHLTGDDPQWLMWCVTPHCQTPGIRIEQPIRHAQ